MKVYITKHALKYGIKKDDGEICEHSPKFISCLKYTASGKGYNHYSKPDWHETWEEALEQAIRMKIKKIVSLQKQLTKLEKLDFKKENES
jgi:phospholipid N-methyltransferase